MAPKNTYLMESFDEFMKTQLILRQHHDRFISEIIHSSFLLAIDKELKTVALSLDNRKYAFIFTDADEFEKAFPADDMMAIDYDLDVLIGILNKEKFDALILNVSSHNFYLTREFLNNLKDVPNTSIIDHSGAYSSEELKFLKNSANNKKVEEFIRCPGEFSRLVEIISSNVLFGLVISDKDMDILECDGVIETWCLVGNFDLYSHEKYAALFTSEDKLKNIETSKFKYLSLVDFATIVHHSIKNEFKGIVINPGEENYLIPVEMLIENWSLIYQTCFDYDLVTAKNTLFMLDDN